MKSILSPNWKPIVQVSQGMFCGTIFKKFRGFTFAEEGSLIRESQKNCLEISNHDVFRHCSHLSIDLMAIPTRQGQPEKVMRSHEGWREIQG